MENKRYLDKVIGSMVRGTKIDYENGRVSPSFFHISSLHPLHSSSPLLLPSFFRYPFSKYCEKQFGLTEEEIDYVWKEYKEIMKDKIENG